MTELNRSLKALLLATAFIVMGCNKDQTPQALGVEKSALVGAWRSKIVFRNGPLAGVPNLEFLHSYNAGGTMTESSNYDEGANSSPPAYGIWKQVTPTEFQTKYVYYTTQAGPSQNGQRSTDWYPAGHGVLTETITLAPDGQAYTSTIKLTTYDIAGAVVPNGSGEGTGAGTRITF